MLDLTLLALSMTMMATVSSNDLEESVG